MTTGRRILITVLLASCALAVLPGIAAGVDRLVVDPGTQLSPGNAVSVTWTGARAVRTITIRQCMRAGAAEICEEDPDRWTVVPASTNGNATFTVAGEIRLPSGTHTCGEWDCSLQVVSDLTPGLEIHPYDRLSAKLHFATASPYDTPTDPDQTTTRAVVADQEAPNPSGSAPDPSESPDQEAAQPVEAPSQSPPAPLAFTGNTVIPVVLTALGLLALGSFVVVQVRRGRPARS